MRIVFPDFRRRRAICSSNSVTRSYSSTKRIRSDDAIAASARALTSERSVSLSASTIPHESAIIYEKSRSSSMTLYSIISRVVFSMSETIAIRCPVRALKRLDFPTFGLQMIVTRASIDILGEYTSKLEKSKKSHTFLLSCSEKKIDFIAHTSDLYSSFFHYDIEDGSILERFESDARIDLIYLSSPIDSDDWCLPLSEVISRWYLRIIESRSSKSISWSWGEQKCRERKG
jgi:hypothetical protein